MVFHEIESITDVVSGHRIIIYYIVGDNTNKWLLCKSVETVMEMLEKKNDDLIIFKVCQNTHHYNHFKELYKPEISGPIALFVINSEGIPLICEQIYNKDNVYQAFHSICTRCKLNYVSESEIAKVIDCEAVQTLPDKTNTDSGIVTNGLKHRPSHQASKMSFCESDVTPGLDTCSLTNTNPEQAAQSTSTVLQIRLPNGTKEQQKFDKQAFLQEVYDFIRSKFNIREFDLKTYNRNVFSAADYEKTLQDLDLTPTGVVIVVCKNTAAFQNNGGISKMIQNGFWMFLAKFTSTYNYVQGLLFAFWNGFFSSGTRSSRQVENQSQANQPGGKQSASSVVKRSTSKFGNIHTLRRSDDSDDENNRYNGNSTQQK